MIFVKPKKDLRVRLPEKRDMIIPQDGMFVNESRDITRLIMSGDLTVDESKKQPTEKPKAKGKGE